MILPIIALLAGSYLQYQAQNNASKKATTTAVQNAARMDERSRQAEKKALDRAADYQTDTRQAEQADIEQGLASEYMAPVESAQAINAATTTTQGDVSADYKNAKAASDLNVVKNARQLAGLMAKVNSANRLRGNEAVRMTDTGMDIDRLANFANREGQIGQYAVQQAGRPDSGMMLAGSLLQGAGMLGMSGAFSGAKAGTGAAAVDGMTVATPTPYGTALSSQPVGTNLPGSLRGWKIGV